MNFRSLIIIFSTFIWILIPLRQYKTRFFGYFFVLAVIDLIFFIAHRFIFINSLYYYLFGTILLVYPTLFELNRKNKILLISTLTLFGTLVVFYAPLYSALFQIAIHIMIMVFFLKILVIYYSQKRKLLIFHLILVIYEFSVILKFFIVYSETKIILPYFLVTTVFEMLMGLFFILKNEINSPELKL